MLISISLIGYDMFRMSYIMLIVIMLLVLSILLYCIDSNNNKLNRALLQKHRDVILVLDLQPNTGYFNANSNLCLVKSRHTFNSAGC